LESHLDSVRQKYEIEVEGRHIGWVCSYIDLEYVNNVDGTLAIGIDIPEEGFHGRGYGTIALTLYMDYLRKKGHKSFFIQTWPGNTAMIRVIGKLGFRECFVKKRIPACQGQILRRDHF
jgi:RimJ/RimL family protein N-acetyltransferase